MRWLFWLGLLPFSVIAQTTITGRVLDEASKEPLPYCSVRVAGSRLGTISNEEGTFSIRVDADWDTLVFSFVGYNKRAALASSVLRHPDVMLMRAITELHVLEVRPEQEALYGSVVRCAKNIRRSKNSIAKLYFEMNTHLNGQPVEVLACFYNARTDGPHIKSLDLKQGRIGIAPQEDRYFVSLDMTKAMCLFDVRDPQVKFPMNPLHYTSVRVLRKHYRVQDLGTTLDSAHLQHLRLEPRDTSGGSFHMDMWLDATTGEPRSMSLSCKHCTVQPFIPLVPEDRIQQLNMRIQLTFKEDGINANLLDHLELAYDLRYEDNAGERQVNTTAVMHLYEHNAAFILPVFEYDDEQNDYRKITFQPYDSVFWATSPTLVRTAAQEKDREFFSQYGTLTGSTRINTNKPLFESNYAWWSPDKRISLKQLPSDAADKSPVPDIRSKGVAVPASRVNLEAQIYLNVDTLNGSTRHFSATVLDGFRSYYRLPEEPHSDVFLNIFFDLCELERMALEAKLLKTASEIARIRALHTEAVANMHRNTALYLKETQLGKDTKALLRWNKKVKEQLGIDNIALFKL
ncbi:MAG: carboxypeptidase-like regulatory domain-containing protein [Flavobacteriales bacterium]|nr:carboxypeptidase-like regulatory domain-containing protein [Flavobacteriales bacterium]